MGTTFKREADLLVVDHYGWDVVLMGACRRWARAILTIDDLGNRSLDCDLLLDQTPDRSEAAYRERVPRHCRLLLGSDYALLDGAFASLRADALERRHYQGRVKTLLIALGSTDPENMTARVLEALNRTRIEISLEIVLAPTAPHLERVRAMVADMTVPARLHTELESVAELMAEVDLAVGAMGVGALERCCLGLPSIGIVLADNQRFLAESLSARGAALAIDRETAMQPDGFAALMTQLFENSEARVAMSRAAGEVCDGRGASRVAKALGEMVGAVGQTE